METKPKDRHEGYPIGINPVFKKIIEIIPGLFTWFLILSPLIFSLLGYPEVLVIYIAFLTIYWGFRGFRFIYGLYFGIKRMEEAQKIDWQKKVEDLKDPRYKNIKWVYISPVFHEDLDVLDPSLESLANSDIGSENISVVFAFEEKFKDDCVKNFTILKKKYNKKFREMIFFFHPANIPGEVAGVKGANINFAGRSFVELVKTRGEKLEDYLLITCDSDQRFHPKYFSAILYKYLTLENPKQRSYASAIHTFNNNIWNVPPLIRSFSMVITLVILHNWVVSKHTSETFSSYVINLETLEKVEFWPPDVENDDTMFFWNALVRFDGNFVAEEVYIPTYNDAVENRNVINTHRSLYKQQHRWGWGIIVFPITLINIFINKNMSFLKKFSVILALFENRLLYLTVVYLITFGLPLLNIFSPQFNYSSASYNLPIFMSYILTAITFLNLPIVFLRRRITPIPKGWGFFRTVWDYIETFLITINMLTFSFIPFIQAQTELMFGIRPKKHYVTEKKKIS